ncbi:TPA: hypothetical protein I9008_001603 [Clostridium perfringens]|nr:hypothetical protein [Clostridium perfringens]
MRNVNKEKPIEPKKIISGFILTMRNVNIKSLSPLQPQLLGFILTMRNVNGFPLFQGVFPNFVLY